MIFASSLASASIFQAVLIHTINAKVISVYSDARQRSHSTADTTSSSLSLSNYIDIKMKRDGHRSDSFVEAKSNNAKNSTDPFILPFP
jgi:hypothetical protein